MLYLPTSKAIPGNSGCIVMARILGANRQAITSATISTISYTVTDISTGLNVVSAIAISPVSSAVYDNLQTNDPTWDADSLLQPSLEDGLYGYNFKFTIPAADLTPSGDRFQTDFVFTPVTGQAFRFSVSTQTIKVYG